MDEACGTYVDDEGFDNHDYNDDTDDDTDDDTADDNDHKKDSYTAAAVLLPPRPDLAMPGQAGPSQTPKIPCFGMKWASDRCW